MKLTPETLNAAHASYSPQSGPCGLASITVDFVPFEFDSKMHDTSLRCDQIDLDLSDVSALSGRHFEFPVNPEPGYIDGSIYLFGVHVHFLATRLSFGRLEEGTIPLRIDGRLEFGTSGLPQYEDVDLSVQAALPLPLTPDQLLSRAEDAANRACAHSQRDLGKVMAMLAKDRRTSGRLAELNVEVRRILAEREALSQ